MQTCAKHQDQVRLEIERIRNELRADIMAIWKSARPRHLREPELDTVTRRIMASLAIRFGVDEASGEQIIRKCIIVSGTGFRATAEFIAQNRHSRKPLPSTDDIDAPASKASVSGPRGDRNHAGQDAQPIQAQDCMMRKGARDGRPRFKDQ